MTRIEQTIEVDVPVQLAYQTWSRFENFPQFMSGVHEVRRLDAQRLYWRAEMGGDVEEWEAVITEQTPNERIAWQSVAGAENAGTVSFQELAAERTRVRLTLIYQPEGFMQQLGDSLGFGIDRVKKDLERFKYFVETTIATADITSAPMPLVDVPFSPAAAEHAAAREVGAPAAPVQVPTETRAGMGAGAGYSVRTAPEGDQTDAAPPSGGVAVNAGRGSDVGAFGPGMNDDLSGGGPVEQRSSHSAQGDDIGSPSDAPPEMERGAEPGPAGPSERRAADSSATVEQPTRVDENSAVGADPAAIRRAPGGKASQRDANLKPDKE